MKTNTQRILLIWLLFAAMVVFSACTPQQRLNRLVKKHPELVKVDTIKFTDTTFTIAHYSDTIVSLLASRTDTIVLTKNNIITKVFTHRDSIFISSTALPDTIIKTISVPYEYVKPQPTGLIDTIIETRLFKVFWLIFTVILILLVLKKSSRKDN